MFASRIHFYQIPEPTFRRNPLTTFNKIPPVLYYPAMLARSLLFGDPSKVAGV
jgi:hypothetical protein